MKKIHSHKNMCEVFISFTSKRKKSITIRFGHTKCHKTNYANNYANVCEYSLNELCFEIIVSRVLHLELIMALTPKVFM